MPTTCVVGGCSNTVEDGFSLHTFPKDEPTKRLWIKFVQTTRADFPRPSSTTVICGAHFSKDSYDPSVFLKEQFGMKGRRKVLPGKYPTIKSVPIQAKPTRKLASDSLSVGHTSQRTDLVPPTTTTISSTSTTSVLSTTCTALSLTVTTTSGPTSMPSTSSSSSDEPRPKRQRFTERREKEQMIQELVGCWTAESVGEPPDVPLQEESEFEESELEESFTRRSHWTKTCQTELTMTPAKVKKRSKRTQCYPQLLDKGTQTSDASADDVPQRFQQDAEVQCSLDIGLPIVPNPTEERFLEPSAPVQLAPEHREDEPEDGPEDEPEEPADGDYVPSDRSSTDSDRDSNITDGAKIWEEEKFIVFRSSLLSLFTICPICYQITQATIDNVIGTLVSIKQTCIACSWKRTWNSQPFINNTPAGNILLSAAILYAGASPTKTLRVLNHMGLKTHHLRTYFMHQSTFLIPTTVKVWENKQHLIISELMQADRPLVLGGDARADSPGHTAKFSSYTLMELNTNKILNIELIQKNEVSSSSAMELEGFKRTMTWMLETAVTASLDIDCIITDKHLQVAKWIRENLTQHQIKHYFDVWHISKSLKKKIAAIGKKKSCEVVNEWTKSILNHLYWSASSTPDGNPDLMLEKFVSVTNHIQDVHTHDGPLFRECAHPPLAGERPRKWLQPGTEPCERLTDLCTATRLKNDVKKMSPKKQTSRIEAFHALLNFFAPKLTVFSYEGMTARVLLAGLHYNENCNRDAATTEAGEIVYHIDFPRAKSGDYSLRARPTAASYDYVDDLMEETVRSVELGVNPAGISGLKTIPPPLTSGFTKPTLEEALQRQKSRFASQEPATGEATAAAPESDGADGAHASSS